MPNDADNRPTLSWELLNIVREEKGFLHSPCMTERAKVPGGWFVISQVRI